MSLSLNCTSSAMSPRLTASFLASGGVEPYVYAVQPGGAGGSIDSDTGVYTAPLVMDPDPSKAVDTIVVTDDNGDTAELEILITNALGLVCDIIQRELGLSDGRVYLWDQKIFEPTDSDLYVAVGVLKCKPFGSNVEVDPSGSLSGIGSVNMQATLTVDVISRGPAARDRKEEIILALGGLYSQSQQEKNSFNIGRLPPGGQFINLSNVDGAAIPYRFQISVNIQYFVTNVKAADYFDDFNNPPAPVTES